ncbi:hypothetical protein [Phocaeicola vulgatus]|uniref:hypothetical protein n=1 Tax=Phocaeicola vulgatus TaxID=821 RepID=UPI003DA48237
MITFIIIIIVLCLIFGNKADKKNIQKDNEEIDKLPRIYFKSKNLTGTQKFLNLAFFDNEILNSFLYDNKRITLVMKNGRVVSAPLQEVEVHFTKTKGIIEVTVKGGNSKIEFREMDHLFSHQEWEVIYRVLSLAGTTYGKDIFSDWNKNLGTVNSILKAMKFLQ